MSAPIDLGAILEGMLRRVLREELEAILAKPTHPEYATRAVNPLGSARAWDRAVASGAFETFRAGRAIVARWADVVLHLESRPARRRQPPQISTDHEAQLRAALAAPEESADDRRRRALRGAGVVLRPSPANDDARRAARGGR